MSGSVENPTSGQRTIAAMVPGAPGSADYAKMSQSPVGYSTEQARPPHAVCFTQAGGEVSRNFNLFAARVSR